MKTINFRWMAMAALVLFSASAQAAVSCSLTSSGFTSTRDSLVASDITNQGSFTMTCSRLSTDPATVFYAASATNSLNASGSQYRARLGATASYLFYDLYNDISYANKWSKNSGCILGSIVFSSSTNTTGPTSKTNDYYAKIPLVQPTSPVPTSGIYDDTATILVNYSTSSLTCTSNSSTSVSSTFPVKIINTASCKIETPPGTVAFTYTAFAAAPATASTPFAVRCSNTLPYTIALNASAGVVSGLNYALALSATSGTGTGAPIAYIINGTMAAGQAGQAATCATPPCSATVTDPNPHFLTISY